MCSLTGENLVEKSLGFILIRLLGERQFTHQNLSGFREHALFSGGKTALLITPPEVPNDFCNLVDVAGGQLFEVCLVAPRSVRGLLGVRRAQHLENPI